MSQAARRTDIEVLRILVCALVVLLHALLIHAPQPFYHLKAPVISATAGLLAEALRVLVMPLFFIIAGWSAVVSLRRRDARTFLAERGRRILVPLITGMVLVCPLIKYIELRGGRDMRPAGFRLIAPLTDSFWTFLPEFFGRLASTTWSHLWFLAYLLVLSVLLLPLLLQCARMVPRQAVPPVWTALLPGFGLGMLLLLVDGYWPYYPNLYGDIGNLCYYGACLGLGAGLAAWPGSALRLQSAWPGLLLAAVAGFGAATWFGEGPAGRFCVGFTAWCGSATLLGFAATHRPAPAALLDRIGEATLPVYVLHHLPVLALGVLLMPTGLAWPVQVALVWSGGLAASAAAYLLLVRPWRAMRVLFGMTAAYPAGKPGAPRHDRPNIAKPDRAAARPAGR